MLKLLIVDDEEIICQAIANIIDWKAYDIHLIGTCMDGVDAYHTILDECPDIVMTDIRMPGISGLELIERIRRTDLCTQFIILSGYGEFDYAQRAMKCGVRHYLLKPCKEEQIISCIKDVTKDYYRAAAERDLLQNQTSYIYKTLHRPLLQNMIREGMVAPEINGSFFESYEHFLNLTSIPWQLCYVYYLEEKNLTSCLQDFDNFLRMHMPEAEMHCIYIRNILIFFFPNYDTDYSRLDAFFRNMQFPSQVVSVDYSRSWYPNLKSLLTVLIQKLKRYDKLYFIEDTVAVPNFNYGAIVKKINDLIPVLASGNSAEKKVAVTQLQEILSSVSSQEFLMQLCDNIIISLGTQLPSSTMPEITDFLYSLHKQNDMEQIVSDLMDYIAKVTDLQALQSRQYSPFIASMIDYLNENYADPNLTLKWISENYLYMNVSYVSRCFTKETGEKFSSFLMKLRIQKAKEILATNDKEKIQNVAELVGCGNTPYYFSKIFKKCTGMTPSAYVKKMNRQ